MLAGCVPLLEVVRDNLFPAHLGCGRIHLCEGVEWRSTFSWSFPGGSDSKESAYNGGDRGSVPGLGRSPGEGNDNPLQYSCLGNPMEARAWWTTVHGVGKNRTWLSDWPFVNWGWVPGPRGCCPPWLMVSSLQLQSHQWGGVNPLMSSVFQPSCTF